MTHEVVDHRVDDGQINEGALVVIDILSTSVALRRDPEHKKQVANMKRRLQEFRGIDAV